MNIKVNPSKHPRIVQKYNEGVTQAELGSFYGVSPACICAIIQKSTIPHRRKWGEQSRANRENESNPQWRGDNVGLPSLHEWVGNRKPRPELCEACGINPPFDLATIEERYTRNLDDWEWLCRGCHMRKDGRMKNLKQYSRPQKTQHTLICPICGANEKYIYTNNSGPYEGRTFCAKCEHEIIPLVTPQEER